MSSTPFPLDSITAKESQIKELLKDPNNNSLSLKDDQQNDFSSLNKVDGSVKDILKPMLENKDNDSLSSILSEIDNPSQKNENHIFTNFPSSSFLSSSDSTSSSSSNNTSINNLTSTDVDTSKKIDQSNEKY